METLSVEGKQGNTENGDKTGMNMKGIKSEGVQPYFNDDNLKAWTEFEDSKKTMVLPKEKKKHDLKGEELEEYEVYSDHEIRDDPTTGSEDTEALPSLTEHRRKKQSMQALKNFHHGNIYHQISKKAKCLIKKLCQGAPVSPTVANA